MVVCSAKNFYFDDKVNGAKSGQKENRSYISTKVVLTNETTAFDHKKVKDAFKNLKNSDFAISIGKNEPAGEKSKWNLVPRHTLRVELCHLKPVSSEVLDLDYNYDVAEFVLDVLKSADVKARAEFCYTERHTYGHWMPKNQPGYVDAPRNF